MRVFGEDAAEEGDELGVWREGLWCYWDRGGGADCELGCWRAGGEEGEEGF